MSRRTASDWQVWVKFNNGVELHVDGLHVSAERISTDPLTRIFYVYKPGYGRKAGSVTTRYADARTTADRLNGARRERRARPVFDRSKVSNARRRRLRELGADWEIRKPGRYAIQSVLWGESYWHVADTETAVREYLRSRDAELVFDLDTGEELEPVVSVHVRLMKSENGR